MVYLLLGLALFCLTVQGYCGKKSSTYAGNNSQVLLFNLVRLVLCVPISLGLFLASEGGLLLPELGMLAISLLSGVANASFLVGWMLAVQKNTMVAVDVTLTLGSLLPAVLCALLFSESISLFKMLGFALILLASFILSGGRNGKGGLSGLPFLLLAVLGDGMVGFSQQLFKQYYTEGGRHAHGVFYSEAVFHFYTYLFAAVVLLIVFLVARLKARGAPSRPPCLSREFWRALPYIAVMAACLFLANDFQLRASADYGMPSQVLYPIMKGGCLITANVTALFFGERFTRRSALGTLTALGGILLMNLL